MAMPRPQRLRALLHPIALAAGLALAPAHAAEKHWTFIGGCASADWFGMLSGINADGGLFCWSSTAGGKATAFPPTPTDDVFIRLPGATSTLLVEFDAPSRGDLAAQAQSLTLSGSATHAVGLRVGRGSLLMQQLTLGAAGQNLLGRLDLAGGSLTVAGTATVLGGSLNQSGGSLIAPGPFVVGAQTAAAGVALTGGSMVLGVLDIGSVGGAAASFSQLGGTLTTLSTHLGTTPSTTASTLDLGGSAARWTNAGTVTVGVTGSARLTLAGGAQAQAGGVLIGGAPGGQGLATVQGSGTTWTVGGLLAVGQAAPAELRVLDGGLVQTQGLRVDSLVEGAAATARVSGGRLQAQTAAIVGQLGRGVLEVGAGGRLDADFGLLGDERGSEGLASVAGAGSEWRSFVSLVVGDRGRGTVEVGAGGLLTAPILVLGTQRNASGTLGAAGADARVSVSGTLTVGQAGKGTLTLADGARLDSASAAIGFAIATGHGEGATSRAGVTAGARWDNRGELFVGQGGSGALTVGAGGTVTSGALLVGAGDAARGVLAVRGAGSFLDLAGLLTVAGDGRGELELSNQALLQTGGAVFGARTAGEAVGTLGHRSTWTNRGDLVLGDAGQGRLVIDGSGARLQTGALVLGRSEGGKGTLDLVRGALVVDRELRIDRGTLALGAEGLATVAGLLRVGDAGRLVLDGGTLSTDALAVAGPDRLDWAAGTLQVTGSGGLALDGKGLPTRLQLGATRQLVVSQALRLDAGSALELQGGRLAAGTLSLRGGTVRARVDGARLDLATIGLLEGQGTVDGAVAGGRNARIVAGGALTLGRSDAADGYAVQGTLEVGGHAVTLLDADGAELGRLTTVGDGGRLAGPGGLVLGSGRVLQAVGEATLAGPVVHRGGVDASGGRLRFEGDVSGGGSFAGALRFEAGYAPGDGIGAVRFGGGDASFGSASRLTLEIDGTAASAHDRLLDLGTLDFGGALTLAFGQGFAPAGGTVRLQLLDFDAFSGAFDPQRITVTGLDPALWRVDSSRLGVNGQLWVQSLSAAVAPVPEPGTWAMGLAGLALLAGRRAAARRRA